MTQRIISRTISAVVALMSSLALAHAVGLPSPTGKPILTISGNIVRTNVGDSAQFDLKMLEQMGLVELKTTTPWYQGAVTFEGVSLQTLMEVVGANGHRFVVHEINYETAEIPVSDLERFHPILALKRDGNYMPVSDKGPLLIVYPFDSDKQLKNYVYYDRSAWGVEMIVVK